MRPRELSLGTAQTVLLDDGQRLWTASELDAEVQRFAALLLARRSRVFATLLDNSPAWIAADRAALEAGAVHVPLPAFFTAEQIAHAMRSAGVDLVLAAPGALQMPGEACALAGQQLRLVALPARPPAMPPGTVKLTFTSGTTGTPKGVCLTQAAMSGVSEGLVQATAALGIRRHLCALPFAVLLENIAGLTAPLASGACCIVLPLRELGLQGSSSFDPALFHAAVERHQPHSAILLPQMLRAWVAHLQQGGLRACASLKLVAVGGAAVGAALIEAAQAVGIPACEGYGLSEGASVQTLNLPGAERAGSAGRVLPHARLRLAADGEIEVAGTLFAGYLGDTAPAPCWWPTGDLGSIDADGFVHLHGRKKNLLITAFGRNVSPEWIETRLRDDPELAQAVVFGDGQPALAAVLWPMHADASDPSLQAVVDRANASLPDYARVLHWQRGRAAFAVHTGFATANGRPRRSAILQAHADLLATPWPAGSSPSCPSLPAVPETTPS